MLKRGKKLGMPMSWLAVFVQRTVVLVVLVVVLVVLVVVLVVVEVCIALALTMGGHYLSR